jgi:hypothetical protein
MSRKRHTSEQIIGKLREAEVELAKGHKTSEVVRKELRSGPIEDVWKRYRRRSLAAT